MSARDDYPLTQVTSPSTAPPDSFIPSQRPVIPSHPLDEIDRLRRDITSLKHEIDRLRDLLTATEQSRYEWQRRALGNSISSFNEHVARRDDP